jgi:hypothetical protein
MITQQPVHLRILALSTVNAQHYPERHRMMVFMVVFMMHCNFTAATKSSVPFKWAALAVCTMDECLQWALQDGDSWCAPKMNPPYMGPNYVA